MNAGPIMLLDRNIIPQTRCTLVLELSAYLLLCHQFKSLRYQCHRSPGSALPFSMKVHKLRAISLYKSSRDSLIWRRDFFVSHRMRRLIGLSGLIYRLFFMYPALKYCILMCVLLQNNDLFDMPVQNCLLKITECNKTRVEVLH